ncbi:anti-sigma factor domain-containing protein [Streptomyces sp. NPDC021020]|uniref:anti-sigma factor n=1 Tax=Streptomyces sp. NPDC021020 TaxID=3365109 RepID=UPI0037B318BF
MTAELHTLTGAYALGAVSGPEERAFRRHLAVCDACREEVRELTETAARLAMAVAEVPPPGMRERVMAALPEVRQLPPHAPAPRAVRRRWRISHLALAACVAVAAVATGVAIDARHRADVAVRAEQRAAELSAVTAAPDATFHTGALTGGGTATVVSSPRLARSAVLFHGLPALPDSHVYELWYRRDGAMVPAGLLPPGRPAGAALLDGTPTGADAVGVTAEPPGGSSTPTGPPLVVLPL